MVEIPVAGPPIIGAHLTLRAAASAVRAVAGGRATRTAEAAAAAALTAAADDAEAAAVTTESLDATLVATVGCLRPVTMADGRARSVTLVAPGDVAAAASSSLVHSPGSGRWAVTADAAKPAAGARDIPAAGPRAPPGTLAVVCACNPAPGVASGQSLVFALRVEPA